MTKNLSTYIGVFAAASVALVLAGHLLPNPRLVYIFKPAATLLILGISFSNWHNRRDSYSLWITIGLLCSLFGDVFLIWPSSFFLPGLFVFLFAHIAYLVAFTRDAEFPARSSIWCIYLAVIGTLDVFLYRSLPIHLRLAVIVYSLFLASMAAQAMGRARVLKTRPAYRAAIGGAFFIISDFLLALDRSHAFPFIAPFLVLIPYYLAQWFIARSTDAISM